MKRKARKAYQVRLSHSEMKQIRLAAGGVPWSSWARSVLVRASEVAMAPSKATPASTVAVRGAIGINGPTYSGKDLPLIHPDGRPVKGRDLQGHTMVEYDTRTGVIKPQRPLTRSYDPDAQPSVCPSCAARLPEQSHRSDCPLAHSEPSGS